MSNMDSSKQAGFVSGVLISLIVTAVLLVGALGFGGWAFMSRQDYKNNSDKKAAVAAAKSKAETEAADAVKYAEEAKSPLTTHKVPDQFGGVTVQYPKTWSGYVIETGTGSKPVDDYFHPGVVPGEDKTAAYALRLEVVDQPYDRVVDSFKDEVDNKKVSAEPYALPKVTSVVGTKLTGQIETDHQGVMIILPMRNLTLKVWTESSDYLGDFDKLILPNLTFAP